MVLTWHVYTDTVSAGAKAWLVTLHLRWNIYAVSHIQYETPIENSPAEHETAHFFNITKIWWRFHLKEIIMELPLSLALDEGTFEENTADSDVLWCSADRRLKHITLPVFFMWQMHFLASPIQYCFTIPPNPDSVLICPVEPQLISESSLNRHFIKHHLRA